MTGSISSRRRSSVAWRLSGLRTLLATLMLAGAVGMVAGPTADAPGDVDSPIASFSEADLAEGRDLFRQHCARCHGLLGEGGEGPSLKRPRLRHAPDDQALFQVISDGIPGTGMPGIWSPSEPERWRIAGYVRSLGTLPVEPLPGDPARGAELYRGAGCPACHIARGAGRGVGPELSDVGLRRNAAYLRAALLDPDADFPMRWDLIEGRRNAFLTVRLTAPGGEYEGLRIREDEFSIQLRDLNGDIHSFEKGRLLGFEKALGHSLMPGYESTLSRRDVDDLVAYLMSLKGTP